MLILPSETILKGNYIYLAMQKYCTFRQRLNNVCVYGEVALGTRVQ
jgi:hypothetical protein